VLSKGIREHQSIQVKRLSHSFDDILIDIVPKPLPLWLPLVEASVHSYM
jgi:hypothetical protein